VYKQIFGWVISLFLFGFFIPGINNWAHGGGILGGILVGWLLGYTEIRQERAYHKTIALICAGLTVIVLLWAVFSAFLIVLK
jgi:rhomboid protease GluP